MEKKFLNLFMVFFICVNFFSVQQLKASTVRLTTPFTQTVFGRSPVIKSVRITGLSEVSFSGGGIVPVFWGEDKKLGVQYEFEDPDGDEEYTDESGSHISWYVHELDSEKIKALSSGYHLYGIDTSVSAGFLKPQLKVCVQGKTDPKVTVPSVGVTVCSESIPIKSVMPVSVSFTPNIMVNDGRPWSYMVVKSSDRSKGRLLDKVSDKSVFAGKPLYFRYIECNLPTISKNVLGYAGECEHVVDWQNTSHPSPYPNLGYGTFFEIHVGNYTGSAVAMRWTNHTKNSLILNINGRFGGDNPSTSKVFDYYIDRLSKGNFLNVKSGINLRSGNHITLNGESFYLEPGDYIQFTQVMSKPGQEHYGAAALVTFTGKGYAISN